MIGWSETVYVCFPDEPTARASAEQLGAVFNDDGSPSSGNEHYALTPFVQWAHPPIDDVNVGEVAPGYWAMMRFNMSSAAGLAAHAAVLATGAAQDPASFTPSNIFC